jgi:hypothetical protein
VQELETLIVQNEKNHQELKETLETLIVQGENNKVEDILEAQLVKQQEFLDVSKELIQTIKDKDNEIEIKVEIVGGEAQYIEEDHKEETEDNHTSDEERD